MGVSPLSYWVWFYFHFQFLNHHSISFDVSLLRGSVTSQVMRRWLFANVEVQIIVQSSSQIRDKRSWGHLVCPSNMRGRHYLMPPTQLVRGSTVLPPTGGLCSTGGRPPFSGGVELQFASGVYFLYVWLIGL